MGNAISWILTHCIVHNSIDGNKEQVGMLKVQWESSTSTYTLDSDSIHGNKAGIIKHI